MKKTSPPRPKGRLLVLILAILGAPVLAELGMRYLLFGDSSLARRRGASLRQPGLYADNSLQDDYWKLHAYFKQGPDTRFSPPPKYDPLLGWRSPSIVPATYEHTAAEKIDGRRPILLYGASYAVSHFELAHEQSELAKDHSLLSYGVGGFGADQVLLLMRESLDHFEGQDPIVVLGLVVNGDFDRSCLSLRDWPKPYLKLDGENALIPPTHPVPDIPTYFEENPVGIRSYLWNYLLRKIDVDPTEGSILTRVTGLQSLYEAREARIEALIDAMQHETESRGFECFYLLFQNSRALSKTDGDDWRETWIPARLRERGIPYVLSGSSILRECERTGTPIADLFVSDSGRRDGHPNARAVEVMFECIERGVRGDFDPE